MYLYVANAESSCLSRRSNQSPSGCMRLGHRSATTNKICLILDFDLDEHVSQYGSNRSGNRAPMDDLFGCVIACLDALCHGGGQRLMILRNPKPIGHLET